MEIFIERLAATEKQAYTRGGFFHVTRSQKAVGALSTQHDNWFRLVHKLHEGRVDCVDDVHV